MTYSDFNKAYVSGTRARMKMVGWKQTRRECVRSGEDWNLYLDGKIEPHFPVPAVQYWVLIGPKVVLIAKSEEDANFGTLYEIVASWKQPK